MYVVADIISFIAENCGREESCIHSNTDIFLDLGCVGDDFHELIEAYEKKFQVDMSSYKWYFHADEEGHSLGGVFFKPPYERVKRIPVTPAVLLKFANAGKWTIEYSEHKLPKYRIDLWINFLFAMMIVVFIIKSCSGK